MKKDIPSHEMPRFMIEVATVADASVIAAIQRDTWLATYPNQDAGITREDISAKGLGSEKKIEFWKKVIGSQGVDKRVWVAKKGGVVVGYCVADKRASENSLGGLYVLPGEQGKGIGKQIMEEAFAWFGKGKRIVLSAANYNLESIAFYRSLGFEEVDEASEVIPSLPSGKKIPLVKMVKGFE